MRFDGSDGKGASPEVQLNYLLQCVKIKNQRIADLELGSRVLEAQLADCRMDALQMKRKLEDRILKLEAGNSLAHVYGNALSQEAEKFLSRRHPTGRKGWLSRFLSVLSRPFRRTRNQEKSSGRISDSTAERY